MYSFIVKLSCKPYQWFYMVLLSHFSLLCLLFELIHIYSAWIDLLWALIWTICSIWQQNCVFVIAIFFLYLPIFGKMNFECHFSCLGWANLMKLLGWNECKLQSAENMKWIDSRDVPAYYTFGVTDVPDCYYADVCFLCFCTSIDFFFWRAACG